MAIYISERSIGIVVPSIHCDGCSVTLNIVGELHNAKLERVEKDPRRFSMSSDGSFVIPGIPITEEGAMSAAIQRGWVSEEVHGKSMLFCPGCVKK